MWIIMRFEMYQICMPLINCFRTSISWKRWPICNCWSYIMGLRLWGPRLSRSLCQSYCSIGLDSWNYWRGRNSLWSWWKRCQMHTKLKPLLNIEIDDNSHLENSICTKFMFRKNCRWIKKSLSRGRSLWSWW